MITTNDEQWLALLRDYRATAWRLEQQPIYLSDVRTGAMNPWLAGETTPPPRDAWSEMVAAQVAAGRRMERVRIFEDEPTPYQQWERWVSAKNVEAGEVQRYVSRSDAEAVGLDRAGDWWLLDSELLIWFVFDGLERVAVEIIDDPARVEEAARWWTVAVELAQRVSVPA